MKFGMEGSVLDVVMTGEAARICGVDRRTFLVKAKLYGILPVAAPGGREIYDRKDVEKIGKKIKSDREAKKDL